ncbi:ORF6N domain-containing protein [Salmonella enterica]|nr:ORF6N domain-containing protein [Salmonella enterica]EHG2698114.1 ORF6N domain-containing protein [Salmonella enterica]EHG7369024.1 ORF6N domain-containing protein [Salmonella enterica]EHG8103708.1 ORF6N domain-containing protein [Salmonella enterica]EHG8132361.1 ORF6N domain-containing protein [Salmonella enterica]
MAKKTELAPVAACDLQIIEYRGQRVVTNEQLAAGYGTDVNNIQQNHKRNADRFIEGKHYFKVVGDELNNLRLTISQLQISPKTRSLMLWTERGAANHAKMLETDQAWNYFNDLTEFYFSYREVTALPSPSELSRLEILKMAIESEEGRLAAEARVEEVTTERDEAIRAKSRISRKREASALGKLSAATRRCRDLEEQLGESTRHATIITVEKATGGKFDYVPLRRWCKDNGVEAKAVPDERYGSVKSWPAGAWLDIYGIDLKKLTGGNV